MTSGTKIGENQNELILNPDEFDAKDTQAHKMTATKIGNEDEFDTDLVASTKIEGDQPIHTPTESNEETSENAFDAEFELEMQKPLADYNNGDLIKGTIRSIEKAGLMVDIKYKSDGFIPNSELSYASSNSKPNYAIGDEINVVINKLETKEGYTILSRKRAIVIETWQEISDHYKRKATIKVSVASSVQGGLVIDYNSVKGFIPASQVIIPENETLDTFVGETLEVIPIQSDWRRRKFICSHKQANDGSRKEVNYKLYDELEPGSICDGKVTSIKDFGIFVDIGGVEGLVHISEMSWSRVSTPSELVEVGQDIQVFVLGVDKENFRISLGMKQLQKDPWVKVTEIFKVGQIHKGKIVRLAPFGAFIRIGDLVEGLIHISELSNEHVKDVSDVVNVGDELDAKIIKLVPEQQKIGLTLRNLQINTSDTSESES